MQDMKPKFAKQIVVSITKQNKSIQACYGHRHCFSCHFPQIGLANRAVRILTIPGPKNPHSSENSNSSSIRTKKFAAQWFRKA